MSKKVLKNLNWINPLKVSSTLNPSQILISMVHSKLLLIISTHSMWHLILVDPWKLNRKIRRLLLHVKIRTLNLFFFIWHSRYWKWWIDKLVLLKVAEVRRDFENFTFVFDRWNNKRNSISDIYLYTHHDYCTNYIQSNLKIKNWFRMILSSFKISTIVGSPCNPKYVLKNLASYSTSKVCLDI